jgi:hypothetical protein
MSSSDLKRTLMDVRKMKRSVRMRAENDPKVVARTLDTLIKESIALSTTDDNAMSRAAVKELQQVRRSLMAGQIDAGQKSASYIGAISGVLDQVGGAAEEAQREAATERSDHRSRLTDSLPSSDTVISALMTANPVLGYSIKMSRDLMSTAKKSNENRRNRDKREAELRRERLEQQEGVLTQQLETDEILRDQALEEEGASAGDVYQQILEEIREEIVRLNEVLNGQSETLERVEDGTLSTTESLEQIHETDREQLRYTQQEDAVGDLTSTEARIERVDAEGNILGDTPRDELDGETAFGLAGMTGLISGGVAGLIAPLTNMFGFLASAGKMLMKFGKFGVVLAAFKMVYDFIDGFFRAEEILGLDDLDWKERVMAGFSNLLSGLLEPVNWLSKKLFGEDLFGGRSRDEMTKQYFDFFSDFSNNVLGMAKWLGGMVVDWFESLFEDTLDKVKSYLPDWMVGESEEPTEEEKVAKEARQSLTDLRQGKRVVSPNNRADKRSLEMEEDSSSSAKAKEKALESLGRSDSESVQQVPQGRGTAPIFAPSSSETKINQHQYQGSGGSENREPAHRRWTNRNGILGAGSL